MAWVKIDDHFDEHPKVMAAGHEAMWLMFRALAFANRGETDGHIPEVALNRIGSDFGPKKRKTLMGTLVEVDLAHRPGHSCEGCPQPSDGWQIHDYADYQPTRKQKDAERAEARDRMAKVRSKKKPRSDHVRSEHNANTSRSSDYPVPGPVPGPHNATTGGSVENGKGGFQGGLPNDIPPDEWDIACQMAEQRRAEGYPVKNLGGFARRIWEQDKDQIRSAIARGTPTAPAVAELLVSIGQSIPEDR